MHISEGSDGKKTSRKNNRDKREEEEQNTNSGINTYPIYKKKIKKKGELEVPVPVGHQGVQPCVFASF